MGGKKLEATSMCGVLRHDADLWRPLLVKRRYCSRTSAALKHVQLLQITRVNKSHSREDIKTADMLEYVLQVKATHTKSTYSLKVSDVKGAVCSFREEIQTQDLDKIFIE